MQVKIEEIQDKGLELNEPIAPDVILEALASSEGFKLGSTSRFRASLKRFSGRVLLHGELEANLTAPCKRCAKDVAFEVPVKFDLSLVPEPSRRDREDGEGDDDGRAPQAGTFRFEEVDSEPFDGKTIRLDPIIREQVLLALPLAVLCQDDCKGLCITCGQDLNEQECGHERKVVDIRLAKLRDIKLN
jgi:uncharacterized protein